MTDTDDTDARSPSNCLFPYGCLKLPCLHILLPPMPRLYASTHASAASNLASSAETYTYCTTSNIPDTALSHADESDHAAP